MSEQAVMSPPIEEVDFNDDDILKFTQRTRKKLVNHLTNDGKLMPNDPATQALLLSSLADMDRQALTKKRITGDNANAEADRQAQIAIAAIAGKFGTHNPFLQQDSTSEKVIDMPSKLIDVSVIPGELTTGIAVMEFRDIVPT